MKNTLTAKLMSRLMILVIIITIVGCNGVQPINLNVHIPELDRSQYNDSFYEDGWRKLREGKPDQAIRLFEKSSAMDEKLYIGFGYAFLAKNKLSLAKKNFEMALSMNSENTQAKFGLASLYELLNEKEEAFKIYSKLRAIQPDNAWVKVRYDYIKTTETKNYLLKAEQYSNNIDEYLDALKKASWYSPEILEIKLKIADYFNQQEKYDLAAQNYEKILEERPNDKSVLYKLAGIYEKMDRFDSAVHIFKKILQFQPGDINAINKINDLKIKFFELNLPIKFKNIFFKEDINREELAALIGYYFEKYLEKRPPVIITDISGSFAKENIINVCTLNIMNLRPDHSFDRFTKINRNTLSVIINALVKYLEISPLGNYELRFSPSDEIIEPADISPLHKDYSTIKYLLNLGIVKLDSDNKFNPTRIVNPTEILETIKKILNSIQDN